MTREEELSRVIGQRDELKRLLLLAFKWQAGLGEDYNGKDYWHCCGGDEWDYENKTTLHRGNCWWVQAKIVLDSYADRRTGNPS